jgi:hypothetical protein
LLLFLEKEEMSSNELIHWREIREWTGIIGLPRSGTTLFASFSGKRRNTTQGIGANERGLGTEDGVALFLGGY